MTKNATAYGIHHDAEYGWLSDTYPDAGIPDLKFWQLLMLERIHEIAIDIEFEQAWEILEDAGCVLSDRDLGALLFCKGFVDGY